MAERRRRRRLSEEESGEDLSEDTKGTKTAERPSECESEDEPLGEDVEVSDYESVTEGKEPEEDGVDNEEDEESEESSEEESDEESDEEETSEEEEDSDVGVDYADEDGLEEERHSGDGEEQPGEENDKELDDDEDRRNPAYVPRRGAFYEHDTRITEDAEKEQQRLAPKKKLWKDEGKWQHDRFREDQQAPKSREELMVLYGYDILASDQPPAAPPRINKSRMRNPQRRHQLKDFIGDPKWSGRRTSPDVQQKNYRNRRPTQGGGGRNRLGDYGDARKDYGDIRHEVIETRRDYGDSRRDYIDNRGDAEEKRKESCSERKWEPVEVKRETSLEKRYHHVEEIKSEPNEKLANDGYHYKKEIYSANKEIVEVKKEVFEPRRDYATDVKKECGNNRRSGDSGDNRSRDHAIDNNRRDYSDHASGANVTWKVPNYVDRAHSNGEVKSNNNFRSNPKSAPSRQYTNANYRGENSDNSKIDSEHFSSPPSFKKTSSESNSNNNYKNLESNSYRGSDSRGYKANHDTAHRNNVIDNNRGYRNLETSNSAYSYRNNNENKQRTPERNFCHEEVTNSSLLKQKGAILNHVEFSGSVVTANNNVEKKSYSKERRMKGMSRTAMQQPPQTISPHESSIESERSSFTSENTTLQQQEGKLDLNTGSSKTENVSRPKRYSTQRQRNLPEVNYPDQIPVDGTTYYSPNYSAFSLPEIRIQENSTQDFTQGPPPMFHPDQGPPSHQEGATFQPTMLQAHTPIPYTLPVSTTGIPSPPRMFGPPPVPVSLATAPPAMLPPQYIGPGVIYGAPPPGPYQVPVIPGYQSPPPPPHSQTAGLQEMYRGGTTYYSTDLQQPSPSRSPVRRQKSAIPIINPQDVKNNTKTTSANPTDSNASSNCVDDLKKQDSVQEANSATKAETAKSRESAAESMAKAKQSESLTPTTSQTAIESLSSVSKSCTLTSQVVAYEKSSSDAATADEHETNSIAAHKPVELADSCAPSEQTTQPILEAAA